MIRMYETCRVVTTASAHENKFPDLGQFFHQCQCFDASQAAFLGARCILFLAKYKLAASV